MFISVIVPAFQSAAHLSRCLEALSISTTAPLEILVVDDGSTDDTVHVARRSGAAVMTVRDGPRGPAAARNLGAATARGDVVFFLDADVAVHPDTLEKIHRCLATHADVAAVFGSYDDRPEHPSMVSQYRNLVHHFVHQQGRREATTFWAGCGAIRREVFAQLGGFDERYRRPSIEDIELGGRLRDAGYRVWLCPDIQATHLKRWSFTDVLRADIRDRAIPWTRLILQQPRIPQDLNTGTASRISAVAVWIAVISVLAAIADLRALWIALAVLAVVVSLNAKLYGFFVRKRGLAFGIVGTAMHCLYLLYSSAVFAVMAGAKWLGHPPRGHLP